MDLAEFTAKFRALREDEQLQLLEQLSEFTEYADEIGEGLQKAAWLYCREVYGEDAAEYQTEELILPPRCSHKAWIAHADRRTMTLKAAFERAPLAETKIATPSESTSSWGMVL